MSRPCTMLRLSRLRSGRVVGSLVGSASCRVPGVVLSRTSGGVVSPRCIAYWMSGRKKLVFPGKSGLLSLLDINLIRTK